MSQKNVEIVRRASRIFSERDFSKVPEVLDPEIVIDLSRNVFNPTVYHGYGGVRRFIGDVDEIWDGSNHQDPDLSVELFVLDSA
jgi:hypothetical protein